MDNHVDLGDAPGRANAGDNLLTLVASALAGGDCIDDADALRAGGTDRVLGCVVKAPSTLGTFLRSFRIDSRTVFNRKQVADSKFWRGLAKEDIVVHGVGVRSST